jgi:mRNA interferase MazF
MNRGDLVVVSAPGDYGKPRPALIIQSDLFNATHASVVVCLMTTDLTDAPLIRLDVEAAPENGLKQRSQIMIDKVVALRRERMGARIGQLDADTLVRVNRSLALFLGLGD